MEWGKRMAGDVRRVKVSLIIPVYNTAAYLRDCLGSVMRQTFQDWEALVVDDGSTDGSGELCRELSQQDPRIRPVSQENRGVSAARNRALEQARGEYLFFLDSDDAIHPRLLEELLREVEAAGAELAFTYTKELKDPEIKRILSAAQREGLSAPEKLSWRLGEGPEARRWFSENGRERGNQMRRMGGKFLSRELLSGLRFEESLTRGEDTFFLYRLVQKNPRTVYMENPWYFYRFRSESLTHSLNLPSLRASRKVFHMIREDELRAGEEEYAANWNTMLLWYLMDKMNQAKQEGNERTISALRQILLEEMEYPLYRKAKFTDRLAVFICIRCYPLYRALRWGARQLRKIRKWEE